MYPGNLRSVIVAEPSAVDPSRPVYHVWDFQWDMEKQKTVAVPSFWEFTSYPAAVEFASNRTRELRATHQN